MEKHDGKLIVDHYLNLERIINRLDAVACGANDADIGNEAWRAILEDEALKAVEGLTALKKEIEGEFDVKEYIQNIERKFKVEAEAN